MDELTVMVEAASAAGKILLTKFKSNLKVSQKSEKDFVTNVDLESEALILDLLKHHFPDYGIYSEEKGVISADKEYQFIIDPLDGTHNYINGWNQYGVALALAKNGKIVKAVTYLPTADTLVFSEEGEGVFCNGKPVRVSSKSDAAAMIILGMNMDGETYEHIRQHFPFVRVIGSAAVIYAGLACGDFSGFVIKDQKKYDLAPGLLYLPEAGGQITDNLGNVPSLDSQYIVASNGRIHDVLLSLLQNK